LRKNDRESKVANINDVIMLAVEVLAPEGNVRGVTLTANFDAKPLLAGSITSTLSKSS
jgi:hypothetical protein